MLPPPPGESTLSVSTTPNQYADICLYTINLPDAVTGCHSNSDAIMLLCRHCCHRPLPKRYGDPSVCLSVPARRNCLRRAAAIGHRVGHQRCADCGQNKIKINVSCVCLLSNIYIHDAAAANHVSPILSAWIGTSCITSCIPSWKTATFISFYLLSLLSVKRAYGWNKINVK